MEGIDLIQDFAILLLAAGLSGILCRRLGLSVIVGYLVAGIIIGPHTPPLSLIVDQARITALSQVGLVFLMFSIGLGLSLTRFGRMGAPVLVATGVGAFLVLNLTELLGLAAGWTPLQAMFVAAMLMVSSSAVISKVVSELKISHERSSQLALAVTVLEDVVAVIMLTLLAGRTAGGAGAEGMGRLLGGLGAFIVLLLGAGLLLIPRMMRRLEARADPEMQTIIVAGVLFLFALLALKAGYSIALGSFLFGAMVAEIPQKAGVERSFTGLRDMFSSVFFVSIGMMIDVRMFAGAWPAILGLSAFALFVRPLACGSALILAGFDPREARRAGLLLTPLAEFSFITAQLGITASVLPASWYSVIVGASILTVFAAPLMSRHRETLFRASSLLEPRWLKRTIEAYHGWVLQLRARPSRTPAWRLLRGRFAQIAVEMLLVSGLLIYSGQLLQALLSSSFGAGFNRGTLAAAYWACVTVLVLIPLVAVWRNCAVVAMISAESLGGGLLPGRFVERLVKSAMALGIGCWLYLVIPHGQFSRWSWLVIAAGAAIIVAVFSSRLIYWHSMWHLSVREVLGDAGAGDGGARAQARASLGEGLGAWNLVLADCSVPDSAPCAGRTLAELSIPARFGCSVVELDRNGHTLADLGPSLAIFPGDRLLLLGEAGNVERACAFIGEEKAPAAGAEAFESTVLDTCAFGGHRAGRTLAELQIPAKTGVRILGIQRGGRRLLNPAGDQRLEKGDSLLILGTLAGIRRFRRWLAED